VKALGNWAVANRKRIDAARRRFDARNPISLAPRRADRALLTDHEEPSGQRKCSLSRGRTLWREPKRGCPLLALSGHGFERQSMSALPRFSDVDLFGNGKRIVHLDP
jgi:hypothetical protein